MSRAKNFERDNKISVTSALPPETVNALDKMYYDTRIPKWKIINDALMKDKEFKKYLD